jgi:hypothetical protein
METKFPFGFCDEIFVRVDMFILQRVLVTKDAGFDQWVDLLDIH